jgi:hypothetical protein
MATAVPEAAEALLTEPLTIAAATAKATAFRLRTCP